MLAYVHGTSTLRGQAPPADFLLSEGKAGRIELGMSVDEVLLQVGRDRVRLVDLVKEGLFSPAIEVEIAGGSQVPAIVADIREWPCAGFAVWGIAVHDPRFRTVDGLGVGSTVGQLRKAHSIQLSHEEGVWAIVPDLKMSFGLDSTRGTDTVRVTHVWIWPDPTTVRKRRCPNR